MKKGLLSQGDFGHNCRRRPVGIYVCSFLSVPAIFIMACHPIPGHGCAGQRNFHAKHSSGNDFSEFPIFQDHHTTGIALSAFEPKQRAHSSQLCCGVSERIKNRRYSLRSKIPRSLLRGASMITPFLSWPYDCVSPAPALSSLR